MLYYTQQKSKINVNTNSTIYTSNEQFRKKFKNGQQNNRLIENANFISFSNCSTPKKVFYF
jgi:hypothetical protein